MKEHLEALAAIKEDLAAAASGPAPRAAQKFDALIRSVNSICTITEKLLEAASRHGEQRRPSSASRPRDETIGAIGETPKSPAGYWFRVTRVKIGEAGRVRVELMKSLGGDDRAIRSIDSTDQAFRELGEVLAKI